MSLGRAVMAGTMSFLWTLVMLVCGGAFGMVIAAWVVSFALAKQPGGGFLIVVASGAVGFGLGLLVTAAILLRRREAQTPCTTSTREH